MVGWGNSIRASYPLAIADCSDTYRMFVNTSFSKNVSKLVKTTPPMTWS